MSIPDFYRVIRLAARRGEVRAAFEDSFHHFRLVLLHDGRKVERVQTDSFRLPFSLCPAAGLELSRLEGTALTVDVGSLTRSIDARQQCTHQFDLATLSVTLATRADQARRYDIRVTAKVDGQRIATLLRDGRACLQWTVVGQEIVAPLSYEGVALGKGFSAWAAGELESHEAEAALVLRRGVFVAEGLATVHLIDALKHPPANGGCWVRQPIRHAAAKRNVGSTLDFADNPAALTAADSSWLEFADGVS
jgi:hypothetical protein